MIDFREEWAGRAQWRLLATGWQSAHALLQAWHDWRNAPPPGATADGPRPGMLHLVCAVPWPPARNALTARLAPHLLPLAAELAAAWWGLVPGLHRLQFDGGRVQFTLFVGPLADALRELTFAADALVVAAPDADAPRDLAIIKALARLSRRGALLVANEVDDALRHDLRTAGFQVEAGAPEAATSPCAIPCTIPSASLRARYAPAWNPRNALPEARLATHAIVIGAGLAGASVASALARRGWQVEVLDAAAEPANGASGLPAGLMAPHLTPDDNLLSRLTRAGIRLTLAHARNLLEVGRDWQGGGTLEHRLKAKAPALDAEAFAADWSCNATPAQRAAAGLPEDANAAWHAPGGWIRPGALVRAWLQTPGITWRGGCQVARLERFDTPEGTTWGALDGQGDALAQAPLVVIAAALGSAPLAGNRLWLNPVRGQISWAPLDPTTRPGLCLPAFPINGNGHLLPDIPLGGQRAWMCGASYGRGETDLAEREADHQANLERLQTLVPATARQLAPDFLAGRVRSWTGVRCACSDRRPLVGPLESTPGGGVWISTAMGSRGLSFAALCAELLASRLHAEPLPLPASLAAALDVARQLKS